MDIGIYISGLGQSFVQDPVEKYMGRLMNEMSYNTRGIDYEMKIDKVSYAKDKKTTVVSICQKGIPEKVVYKMYDFQYRELLIEKFNGNSLIAKNFWLFLLVIRKFPLVIKRLFIRDSYARPFQTLYLFGLFLLIASFCVLMLPATIEVVSSFLGQDNVQVAFNKVKALLHIQRDIPFISVAGIKVLSATIVTGTSFLLLIVPNANILIAGLATEFACANDYLEYGAQKQLIHGNIDLLVDYISEKEPGSKIHIHSYSFGSLIAIDYIFPYGSAVNTNTENCVKGLITIGTPFEFVKTHYPQYYKDRQTQFANNIFWLNIYSIADAMATNFRQDGKIGDAEFGIDKSSVKPLNINYEVASLNGDGIWDSLALYSLKAHGMYWDPKIEGQSCLKAVYQEMAKLNMIEKHKAEDASYLN
jgi:hypothetical protein